MEKTLFPGKGTRPGLVRRFFSIDNLNNEGFMLLEFLVSIVVLGIVSVAITPFLLRVLEAVSSQYLALEVLKGRIEFLHSLLENLEISYEQ